MAAGYLARLASDSQISKMAIFAKKLYFTSEDDRNRIISGEIVEAIANSTDRFAALASDFVPFIFIAKHDSHEQVKERFQTTWSDNVGGSRTVLLYLPEIVDLASSYLESTRHVVKQTSALAIAGAVTLCGKDIGLSNADKIWPALDKAVGGKSWEGKEIVLKAFVLFAQNEQRFWRNDSKIADHMQKIIYREAKRQNAIYRPFALESLGCFSEVRDDVDMSQAVYDIVAPIIDELIDTDRMVIDSDTGSAGFPSTTRLNETTIAQGIKALFRSVNPRQIQGPDIIPILAQILQKTEQASSEKSTTIYNAILDGEITLFEKLGSDSRVSIVISNDLEKILVGFSEGLFQLIEATEPVRQKKADCILALAKVSDAKPVLRSCLQQGIAAFRVRERSSSVQNTLDSAAKMLAT
ncbi:MAG: hypothetical protein M1819_004359 [Sarea resinae]|nr:MAG: hypothetical protein M1819_004359 [Sarea resinae]